MKTLYCCDLFCGAGGFSTGLIKAAAARGYAVDLTAINHSLTAIETHSTNHPTAIHYCESIEGVAPRQVIPGGYLDLLLASPACTHHSNARGGKPMCEQERATAWHILRFAEELLVAYILIENVREFRDWGPLHGCTCGLGDSPDLYGPHVQLCKKGRPIQALKGKLYRQFLSSLRALGYTVSERLLTSADYGDATTRQRLFIQARRGTKAPSWPVPTHIKTGDPLGVLEGMPKWKPARDIIDWSIPGRSIYNRKTPLRPNTMRRIISGLFKYSGLSFIIGAGGPTGAGEPQSVDKPLGTILTDNNRALVEPFLVVWRGDQRVRSLDEPVPTMTTDGGFGLCWSSLIVMRNNCDAQDLDRPVPGLTCGGNMALCQAYILGQQSCAAPRTTEEPLPTVACAGAIAVAQPFVMPITHAGRADRGHDVDHPLPTVTTQAEFAVIQSFLMKYHGSHKGKADGDNRTASIELPFQTLDTSNRIAVVQPLFRPSYLINFQGKGSAFSLDDPLGTATTRDRFALVTPEVAADASLKGEIVGWLDILLRMLQPHELAGAMGFPASYFFAGNREKQVRQIGNAVSVGLAEALCGAIIDSAHPVAAKRKGKR